MRARAFIAFFYVKLIDEDIPLEYKDQPGGTASDALRKAIKIPRRSITSSIALCIGCQNIRLGDETWIHSVSLSAEVLISPSAGRSSSTGHAESNLFTRPIVSLVVLYMDESRDNDAAACDQYSTSM